MQIYTMCLLTFDSHQYQHHRQFAFQQTDDPDIKPRYNIDFYSEQRPRWFDDR